MPDESQIHVFGIRHHGPGSARSLVRALESLAPDIVLIEGPSDAEAVMHLAGHEGMEPPVALLLYDAANPRRSAYYPFAGFSPEWQAMVYALRAGVKSRFIDLPQSIHMAIDSQAEIAQAAIEPETNACEEDSEGEEPAEYSLNIRQDPLGALAKAAGYEDGDGERWWERMVEHRQSGDPTDLFDAVREAMQELRETLPLKLDPAETLREERREAYMRKCIRDARKEGFARIAVVCGAWHAPVLGVDALESYLKADTAILKALPKPVQVAATWVPWTYDRLAVYSGYGAGIRSPGWYDHLWTTADSDPTQIAIRWIIKVAHLLREEGLDASSAHIIEAVRLAECLSSMRGHAVPGLFELSEAVQTVLCFGSDVPMRLINEKLIVAQRLGRVPDETPMVPLQQDLQAHQRRLRLPAEAGQKVYELDLRNANDLARSRLLHRLTLIQVPWGVTERASGKGTFHENWRLHWQPELTVALIAAGVWGNTIEDAASESCAETARKATDLPSITALLGNVLLAELPVAAWVVMRRLEDRAALASDPVELMAALPQLVDVARYGDVRGTDSELVSHVIDGLIVRICVGLPGACASLNDDAAGLMFEAIVRTNAAIGLLQNVEYSALWRQALRRVADMDAVHGLVAGRCVRVLYDDGAFESEPTEVARRLGLALSQAVEPAQAAAWIEGFLRGSGLMLIHDDALWRIVNDWVAGLNEEQFMAVLPLVRRTFGTFTAPERRQMGEIASRGPAHKAVMHSDGPVEGFDPALAEAALPVVAMLLGLTLHEGGEK